MRVLVRETRNLLEQGDIDSALAFFCQIHPADQGDVLVAIRDLIRLILLAGLEPSETAAIIEHIEPEEAVAIFVGMNVAPVVNILYETSSDVVADILHDLPASLSRYIIEGMSESAGVAPLLEHAGDTPRGLMIPDYPVVPENISAADALGTLRLRGPETEYIRPVLVLDYVDKLAGTSRVIRLALARPNTSSKPRIYLGWTGKRPGRIGIFDGAVQPEPSAGGKSRRPPDGCHSG